ncbi:MULTISPECIES: hypothetical protein [Bacillus cereus group]|uniref:Uncharacterized protein n=1 Tax=Bacillus cereus TaxID=1396 RepID=A0A9W7QF62_BACCE|nr:MULTISPECIES: hypothetical protein [Bacillus cereus group]KAB2394967.1 hypothetical protein F8172_16180 [Bacillus cereus]KAB2410265.1 hypothetical protein F8170_03860 [Bacillus cereus]KAB2428622.1 hypothetical protein F8168_17720 [Bacillus cereus]OPD56705.1 hypothetical protein BVG01_22985 [Bacillus anthracis]CUB38166.1 hypothetical protein BN2127_JRS4_02840 [Bacillus cereus]
MRLVVIHDSEGTIISLTAIPPNGLSTGKVLKPGEYMTELETMEIMLNLDEEEIMKHLLNITDNYKLDISSNTPRLIKLNENELQKINQRLKKSYLKRDKISSRK